MLLASPLLAVGIWHGADSAPQVTENQAFMETTPPPIERIPVEIVAKGSVSQWVYVEVPVASVPEPGVVPLMVLASLLLLRRQREPR